MADDSAGDSHGAWALWPLTPKLRQKFKQKIQSDLTSDPPFGDATEPQVFKKIDGVAAEELGDEIENDAYFRASHAFEKWGCRELHAIKIYIDRILELSISAAQGVDAKEKIQNEKPVTELDISTGPRQQLNAAQAEELLKPLFSKDHHISKLVLSNNSFGLDSASVCRRAIENSKSVLKEIDMSDVHAGRKESDVLLVLQEISEAVKGCNLRSLKFSKNALGEKGVRACAAALISQKNLEEIAFCDIGGSPQAINAIIELLSDSSSLKTIHFHLNMSGDEGAKKISSIIKNTKELRDFRFSSSRVNETGLKYLSDALSQCQRLESLNLQDNPFGPRGGDLLSKALINHSDLKHLNLGEINLENHGVKAVIKSLLVTHPPLETLNLKANEITSKSAKYLVLFLEKCSTLKEIYLGENELRSRGLEILEKGFRSTKSNIEVIDFSSNGIKSDDIPLILKIFGSQISSLKKIILSENRLKDEGISVLSDFISTSKMEELDLSSTGLKREGALRLANIVLQIPGFKSLNIDGNEISQKGVDELKRLFSPESENSKRIAFKSLDENECKNSDEEDEDDDEDEYEDGDEDEDEDEDLRTLHGLQDLSLKS